MHRDEPGDSGVRHGSRTASPVGGWARRTAHTDRSGGRSPPRPPAVDTGIRPLDACSAVRVLLATPRFAPQVGGAETWTLEVCAGLVARGHRVEAVARAGPEEASQAPVRGVEVRRVPGGRLGVARAIGR